MKVQGGAITPASPVGAVVAKGMVFIPLRLVSLRDGKVQILRIPFTYLQVESVEGSVARCKIIQPDERSAHETDVATEQPGRARD